MDRYLWKTIYNVGVSELDDQHKEIISILNELAYSLQEGKSNLISLLDKLIEYTNYHFQAEESYCAKCNYPFIDNDLKEHRELRERILNLKDKFEIYGRIQISEVTELAKELQVKHMMLSGKRIGIYLNEKTNSIAF